MHYFVMICIYFSLIYLFYQGLNLLMDRLADKKDPLLVKIVRNLSMWTFNQQEVYSSKMILAIVV